MQRRYRWESSVHECSLGLVVVDDTITKSLALYATKVSPKRHIFDGCQRWELVSMIARGCSGAFVRVHTIRQECSFVEYNYVSWWTGCSGYRTKDRLTNGSAGGSNWFNFIRFTIQALAPLDESCSCGCIFRYRLSMGYGWCNVACTVICQSHKAPSIV